MKTVLLAVVCFCAVAASAAETVWLSSLDLRNVKQGWGQAQTNRSIREKPLSIAGKSFERGVGTHANSTIWLDLGGGTEKFLAYVGVDDAAGGSASLRFKVVADGRNLWESGVMKTNQPAKAIDLDLKGVQTLLLLVDDAGDGISYDHANWADARFVVTGAKPKTTTGPREEFVILTPKPGPAPRINGPRVLGCRPGNPFIFRIPTTGERPIAFSAEGLPASLKLDTATGIVTGTNPARGEYLVKFRAKNSHGEATGSLKIVSGDTLALTPPMGWNHWYTHYDRITDQLMRQAAEVMVSSGMADVGYQYVNIDDCWMNADKNKDPRRNGPFRDASGNIVPNQYFPEMRGMTDYIHSKGLKAGIYTSPGPKTCAGFAGTYQHEEQDAQQFAAWGFDFLKYDWCSYSGVAKGDKSLEALKKPYVLMGDILKRQNRDIVFNLCQYGMGNVWEWGADVGGHCWRTAGDLGFELNRILAVALKNAEHREYSKPGAWNDPDYIQIGFIGNARGMGEPMPCPLTPNEQYAFMSLWCLSAAPLFYSGDMGKLDAFTVNVLCNPEVIDVDQDPLGQCARVVKLPDDTFVMVKDMADGSKAVGLFNGGEMESSVTAKWSDLGVTGRQNLRDLWRQKDLGVFHGEFKSVVPRHGGVLVRVSPAT